MGHFFNDVAFALRSWRRSPGLILAAILAIGLGVAANTTIFSIVSAVLLDPLPYPDPGRIVVVWQDFRKISGREREFTSPGLFLEWQRRSGDALSAVAVVRGWAPSLTGVAEPERLRGAAVSGSYFEVLGATAAQGRLLNADDDRPGAATVVVISHGLWLRRFAGDPSIVGKPLQLDEEPVTVVGVTAPGLEPVLVDAEIWSATRIPPGAPVGMVVLQSIGRLRPDVTLALARERMSAMARQLVEAHVGEDGSGIFLEPLAESTTGPVRTPLLALMASVAFVLMIACVNVALLLMARAAARTREITLRASLGASRWRLVAQLLTETLLLAALGALAGLVITAATLDSILAIAPATVARLADVHINAAVLTFTAALTLITTLIGGLLPAVLASRTDLMGLLRDSGSDPGMSRLHRALVIVEVALAVVLLSGAGQMLRSLDKLQHVDLGFRAPGLVAATVGLPRARYQSEQSVRQFYESVLDRLGSTPDVAGAGIVSVLPLSGSDTDLSFRIEGRPLPATPAEEPTAWFRLVSNGYFKVMGMRIEQGRGFAETDRLDSPCVVLINRSLAERYWSGAAPLGARLFAMGQSCEVAGIVNDIHHRGPGTPPEPEMYFSMHQRPLRGQASIVVRAASTPQAAAAGLRAVIRSEDPALPPGTIRTLEDMLGRTLAQPRFISLMIGGFAGVAFVLALVGVHGLLSYGVARRSREIGIRVAIGASVSDVARLVAAGSAWTVGTGAVAGLAGAFLLSQTIESLLFGVEPGDPLTAVVVLLVVLVAGMLATIVPMRRAMRVDPNAALRIE
ncbi:MAG: ABC transporter permease [Vicinamibacterales bacterium]